MFRKQKGITLIALVITIIVLLILAGVSINLVVGEGGILGKAQNAVSASRAGSVKEEIGLAWSACETEYMEEWVTNQGIDKSTFFTPARLNANLGGKGTVTAVTYNETGDSTLTYASTDGNLVYDMTISSTGQVSIVGDPTVSDTPVTPDVPDTPSGETLFSQITSANYGDKVTYTANGVSDWKVFYKDATNVYIVASDYLSHGGSSDTSKIVSGTGMTKTGTYRAYWNSAPSSADTTNHVAKFSPVTAETKAWTGNYSTNSNGKCVSTLLDTTLWSSYASGVGGESAIGSPTLNMFVASWNEKYPSDKIYCNNDSATGYYVGTTTNPTSTYIDSSVMNQKEGYNNTLYYPYTSATSDSCYGYWLASPSAGNTSSVMYVLCNGNVDYSYYYYTYYGVRPVVSLSSGVKGTSTTTDGVTTWTLSN